MENKHSPDVKGLAGTHYNVKCTNCGLTARVVEGGAPMRGINIFGWSNDVSYCNLCKKLHNMLRCPGCNKEGIRIKPPEGLLSQYARKEPATGTTACPKCGKETLVWEVTSYREE